MAEGGMGRKRGWDGGEKKGDPSGEVDGGGGGMATVSIRTSPIEPGFHRRIPMKKS